MTSVAGGSRLGPYEIVSRVGAGGMGEVFRARDTRLDRTVAIKILSAELTDNAQLKARFEREAKAISQISHPHICALHDVGNADGVEYLVLEFLEGETLAERIARGPLPIADVLRFGSQIASALACAHRAGIVHRDLKPGNVMITKTGTKLLDFGLARSSTPPSSSPTDATQQKPLTQEGTILGTFHYMSPEQLSGDDVDTRSDIFALGAVLYEMLTGVRAFEGKSRASIIASVLAGPPRPASTLRPLTPPALEHVITKCLAREKDERWESSADIASELEWIAGSTSGESSGIVSKRPSRRAAFLTTVAVAAVILLAMSFAGRSILRRLRTAEQPVRSELLTDEPLTPALFGTIALSPDGTQLLLLVGASGKPSLAIRNLTTGETKKLAGTEGAIFPFWAPDSQHVAFFADGKLKTTAASGGSIQTVCDAKQGRGGSWSPSGVIVFTPGLGSPICKVSESGGAVTPVTHLSPGESHRQPMFLPDGKRFLFVARINGTDLLSAGSVEGNLQKRVVENASNAAFARGRLFFVRDGNLVSQPFDPAKLEVSGTLTPLADHVEYFKVRAVGNFSVTETKMVYVSEPSVLSRLAAYDRNGRVSEIGAAGNYRILDVAPDDRTLAVSVNEHFEQGDVWLVQLDGGTKSRLTFIDTGALSGSFSPDGSRFAMSSGFYGQAITIDVRFVVNNESRKVLATIGACVVGGWSHDGRYLVVDTQDPKTGFDVQKIDVAAGTMTPVVRGPADDVAPALSPDGKWLAYVSTESGAPEVYLTAFPSGEGKWQATQDGGSAPRWSRDGKQLFYVKDDRLMTADFRDGAIPHFGSATALPINIVSDRIFVNSSPAYAVTSEGRVITTQPLGSTQQTIHLVTNWNEIVAR